MATPPPPNPLGALSAGQGGYAPGNNLGARMGRGPASPKGSYPEWYKRLSPDRQEYLQNLFTQEMKQDPNKGVGVQDFISFLQDGAQQFQTIGSNDQTWVNPPSWKGVPYKLPPGQVPSQVNQNDYTDASFVIQQANPKASGLAEDLVTSAQSAGIPWQVLFGLVNNVENTQWDPSLNNATGDRGLVQINRQAHPEVTDAQAHDPAFALQWAATQLADYHAEFGDWGLAVLAYHEGEEAVKQYVQNSGTWGPNVDPVEAGNYLQKFYGKGGTGDLTTLGWDPTKDPSFNQSALMASGKAGSQQPFPLPDPDVIRQDTTNFFRSTFFRNPTDQEVSAMVDFVNKKITDAHTAAQTQYGSSNPYASPSAIVGLAQTLQGTPYVYGGTTTSGFDCSGFTQYVYKQFGIDIGRDTGAQQQNGTPVSDLSQAKPGDLIFFGDATGPHAHVGIYIGDGKMISAPNSKSVVRVDDVNSWAQSGEKLRQIRRYTGSNTQQVGGQTQIGGDPSLAAAGGTGGGGNTSDPSATVTAAMTNTPEYKELYSKKPTYMTDQGYASQSMDYATKDLVDVNPTDESMRQGLASGQVSTTAQYMEGTPQGEQSAGLRDRLFAAAEMINKLQGKRIA